VNEDQKERLAGHLRQRQRLVLRLLAIYVLFALGLTMLFERSGTAPDPATGGFFGIVALAMLGMLALALLPHLYLMRKIQPLLAQLPRTARCAPPARTAFQGSPPSYRKFTWRWAAWAIPDCPVEYIKTIQRASPQGAPRRSCTVGARPLGRRRDGELLRVSGDSQKGD
jgi:hypothetical protein